MSHEDSIFCLKRMLNEDKKYTCANCPNYSDVTKVPLNSFTYGIQCPHESEAIHIAIRAIMAWNVDESILEKEMNEDVRM